MALHQELVTGSFSLHAMLAKGIFIIKKDFFTKGASYHFDPPQGGSHLGEKGFFIHPGLARSFCARCYLIHEHNSVEKMCNSPVEMPNFATSCAFS